MSRNRVIPPTQTLFVSSNATGAQTVINQIHRVQSVNFAYSVKRTPVSQYGQQAPIDQIILDPIEASIDFTYLVTNALNENNLGFQTDGLSQSISGFLSKASDEKNYYFLTAPEGEDAVLGDSVGASNRVFGIGNGFISNYSFDAKVGSSPTATVSVEAANIVLYGNSTGQQTPAINTQSGTRITGYNFSLPASVSGVVGQSTALRPGDIFLSLQNATLGADLVDAKVQSVKIGVGLSREPLNKLGSHFPFSREMQFPINVTFSVEANVGDLVTGSISSILCNDSAYDLSIGLRQPNCANTGAVAIQYTVKGAKLDSQSFSTSLGSSETVSLQWTAQLGGPRDLQKGMFISGILN